MVGTCTRLGATKLQKKHTLHFHGGVNHRLYYDKKPQVYLEECKYAVKEKKLTSFIDAELELSGFDSVSDSE